MADGLVRRVTGRDEPGDTPIELRITLTDAAVFGSGDDETAPTDASPRLSLTSSVADRAEVAVRATDVAATAVRVGGDAVDRVGRGEDDPAWLEGYGPLPAEHARALIAEAAQVWIRRVLTDPMTGAVSELDERRRFFPAALRRLIMQRDQHCRQPFCDAPIRHIDHLVPHARGGPTTLENAQGSCARGNLIKALPGWSTRRGPSRGSVEVTTPTGHRYLTRPRGRDGLPGRTTVLDTG